ncbi:MAG: sigma-54-dependent transcriptional regulator [Oceanococcus sp.]
MTTQATALIIDDEADIRALLEITLSRMGLQTHAAANLSEAREALKTKQFSLCLTDMRLPDGKGLEIVREIQASHKHLPVAVITAYGNMEDAVESLKAGAFDFVTKPVDIDTLRRLVNSALDASKAAENLPEPRITASPKDQLTGQSTAIKNLRRMIEKVARNQAPVHICGESGTGKELVAKIIHSQSGRAKKAFVAVNCGAVPTELMESEFFGHVKGSFTGAVNDNPGLFRAAEGGTLFLDEIGDLPLHMQVKLLRAIQERNVRPVGHSQEISVDVRIISATHHKLTDRIQTGDFREDLYYRLNVIELSVPPLRERLEDLKTLSQQILEKIAQRNQQAAHQLDESALTTLMSYNFPGNIRELENILERAAALADNEHILADDLALPAAARDTPAEIDTANIDDSLAATERDRIEDALKKTRYNKTRAAELLGISFRSLRYRLKKLNID